MFGIFWLNQMWDTFLFEPIIKHEELQRDKYLLMGHWKVGIPPASNWPIHSKISSAWRHFLGHYRCFVTSIKKFIRKLNSNFKPYNYYFLVNVEVPIERRLKIFPLITIWGSILFFVWILPCARNWSCSKKYRLLKP